MDDIGLGSIMWVPPGWAPFLLNIQVGGAGGGKLLMVPYVNVGLVEAAFGNPVDRQ